MALTFFRGTQADYDGLAVKDNDAIYFIIDTAALYQGTTLLTDGVRLVTATPTNPATGVMYFNTTTSMGTVWNGTTWTTLIQPGAAGDVANIAQAMSTDATPVAIPGAIEVTYGDNTTSTVQLTGLVNNPTFDATTLTLTLPVTGGTPLTVNMPLNELLINAEFDPGDPGDPNADPDPIPPTPPAIVLTFRDNSVIRIPTGAICDVYTSGSGVNDTVTIVIDPVTNQVSATIEVDTTGPLGINSTGAITFDMTAVTTITDALDTRLTAAETNITNQGNRITTLETNLSWKTIPTA